MFYNVEALFTSLSLWTCNDQSNIKGKYLSNISLSKSDLQNENSKHWFFFQCIREQRDLCEEKVRHNLKAVTAKRTEKTRKYRTEALSINYRFDDRNISYINVKKSTKHINNYDQACKPGCSRYASSASGRVIEGWLTHLSFAFTNSNASDISRV